MFKITPRSNDHYLVSQSNNSDFKFNIGHLKAASVLMASIALVACGGSGSGNPTTTATPTGAEASINGVWRSCNVQGDDSEQNVITFLDGVASTQVTKHTGTTTCNTAKTSITIEEGTVSYTLGSAVTVDGSVSNITTATKLNTEFFGESNFDAFDLIAIKDNVVFFGNSDDTNNGTSDALRPTQLGSDGFTKQVALTSIDGTWESSCTPDDNIFVQESVVFAGGDFTFTESNFGNDDCSDAATVLGAEPGTYTLKSQVTVDGGVKGITNATQINITTSDTTFELVAISGTEMFFSDTDGTNDGSTEALRSTQLDNGAFTKQQK
jgi:hypothetical protein